MNRTSATIWTMLLISALLLLNASLSVSAMDLGANFWNLGWRRPNDCFQVILRSLETLINVIGHLIAHQLQ